MIKEIDIAVLPDHIHDEDYLLRKVSQRSGIKQSDINVYQIIRRSIDARKSPIYRLRVRVCSDDDWPVKQVPIRDAYRNVSEAPEVYIVGSGPAGYFAALECLVKGYKPIVLERGKDVRARRRDLRSIQQEGIVNENSNYCFGEGGAGTYSDGKLYTRSKKRGQVDQILQVLVEHGASEDILIDAQPHIGSNKLPKIIAKIRDTILAFGGDIRFEHQVTDVIIEGNVIKGVQVNEAVNFSCDRLVLATGHSARDVYEILENRNVRMEPKPFALGVRVEHRQALIDALQYGQTPRAENLPAASYKLVSNIRDQGVYSFCMCPGGLIVPAATAPGELVVNGMSMSRRDSKYANAGLVVSIEPTLWEEIGYKGPLGGMRFQQELEQKCFSFSDGTQRAPAQRLIDFVRGVSSTDLPDSSYIPGLISAPLHEILPTSIYKLMIEGIMRFEQKMQGFLTNEAVVVGIESRTSAPIRIPRDLHTYMHPDVAGFYPCGEGAGYAGGIISAAIDGQRVIQHLP